MSKELIIKWHVSIPSILYDLINYLTDLFIRFFFWTCIHMAFLMAKWKTLLRFYAYI